MATILVGGISPESENILNQYIETYVPDATIEPLKAVGVKGVLKRKGILPDTLLIILEDSLFNNCYEFCKEVLDLPKVHKYTNEQRLTEFLISKFGKLDLNTDNIATEEEDLGIVTPDMLLKQQEESEESESLSIETYQEMEDDKKDKRISELELKVSELQDKLVSSDMLVRNLQQQLDEDSEDNEVSELVNTISELRQKNTELEEQLRSNSGSGISETDYEALGKLARAEQLIKEVDGIKAELKEAREQSSILEHDKSELSKEKDEINAKLEELSTKYDDLSKQIESKDTEIANLNEEIDSKEKTLTENQIDIQGKSSEIEILQSRVNEIEGLEEEIAQLKNQLQDITVERDNLLVDSEKMSIDYDMLYDQLSQVTQLSDQKSAEIEEIRIKLQLLEQNGADITSEVTTLNTQIDELNKKLEEANDTIAKKDKDLAEMQLEIDNREKLHQTELEELQQELDNTGNLDEQVAELQDKISQLNSINAKLDNDVMSLKKEITDKDAEIKELTEKDVITQESISVKSEELDKAIAERDSKIEELTEAKENQIRLQSQLDSLKEQLQEAEANLNNVTRDKDNEISTLKQNTTKLEKEISTLKDNLLDAQTDNESITKLESELLEERRKSARLNSKLEVLEKSDNSSKSAELRLEIARLNEELNKAKSDKSSVTSEEVNNLRNELQEARQKIASLETSTLDAEEQLEELTSGVFGQIANLAMPKVAYDVALKIQQEFKDKHVYCYASGSEESSAILFTTIRRSCIANPKARIIILDITTDSTIDRDFGVASIKSPISWITGSEPVTNFLADTKQENVKILSTALAFMNDLFLLNIDWGKRIEELSRLADAVIINVGCINNLVSKILFNSFSQVMRSHLIVKATPINLRATILNITGYKRLSDNVTVDCINFDNSSKAMYQKLASKCKATIIKDSDIIAL